VKCLSGRRLTENVIRNKQEEVEVMANYKSRNSFVRTLQIVVAVPILVFTIAATGFSQLTAHSGIYSISEPPNLGILQDSIRSYIKSGAYERGIAQVIDSAKAFLESRYRNVKNPAIVLDIDETSLSNVGFEYRYGFGFEISLWNAWVKKASASAIRPTLELARWATQRHIAIFFISGREQLSANLSDDPTVINLKKVGYPQWTGLYFKNPKQKMTTAEFKTSVRKQITSEGYTIVVNIGDQYSDLVGGYAEGKFKLPDPMYFIP